MTEEVKNTEVVATAAPEVKEVIANTNQEEKLLKQSEVNSIVSAVKREAYEKAKRDATQELEQRAASQQSAGNEATSNQGFDEETVRKMITEEAEKMSRMANAQKTVNEFTQKMLAAKDKHEDFEDTVAQLNLPTIPHVIEWANSLDNTADVMYELGKTPSKLANVLMLASTSPQLAVSEMKRLSGSIKKNQEAAQNEAKAPQPLSQVKPSPSGTDSGTMTIKDLRKQDWLAA